MGTRIAMLLCLLKTLWHVPTLITPLNFVHDSVCVTYAIVQTEALTDVR